MNVAALIIALAISAAPAAPAGVNGHVVLKPPVIPFHEQATYQIEVDVPAKVEVHIPDMTDHFGGLNVDGVPERDVEKAKDGSQKIVVTYTLDPIRSGEYVIDPVTLTWGKDGKLTLPSPALKVRDLTPAEVAAAEKFVEPTGPLGVEATHGREWPWAVGGVLLLAAVAVALLFWFRRKRPETLVPQLPPWKLPMRGYGNWMSAVCRNSARSTNITSSCRAFCAGTLKISSRFMRRNGRRRNFWRRHRRAATSQAITRLYWRGLCATAIA